MKILCALVGAIQIIISLVTGYQVFMCAMDWLEVIIVVFGVLSSIVLWGTLIKLTSDTDGTDIVLGNLEDEINDLKCKNDKLMRKIEELERKIG